MQRLATPGLLYRLHESQITASARWRLTSWQDPQLARQYRLLTERVLGRGFERLSSLATSDLPLIEFDATLCEFERLVKSAGHNLGTSERCFLEAKLAKRLAAVRLLRHRSVGP